MVGPGAKRGMEFVFPKISFKNNNIMEDYILAVRDHQYDFFEFDTPEEFDFYKLNLERGGRLTTFGVEITFCQFDCWRSIQNDADGQQKRILPLTFAAFDKIAENLRLKDQLFV